MCALVIRVFSKRGLSLAFNHHCNITLHERNVKHLAAEAILYGQMVKLLSKPTSDTDFPSRGNMNELFPQKEILHLLFFLFAQMMKNGKLPSVVQVYHAYLQTPNVCLFKKKKKKRISVCSTSPIFLTYLCQQKH